MGQPDLRVASTEAEPAPGGPPAAARVDDSADLVKGNADVEWDSFDSDAYFKHNYQSLRPDDAEIIKIVSGYFATAGPRVWPAQGIDVGSGANLYPALSMLPFSSKVTLYERAYSNRRWLANELNLPQGSWQQEFWPTISSGRADYQHIKDPLDVLGLRAEVVKGNVFDLRPAQFGIGTMFFVAESITTRTDEFRRATQLFVNSLVPKAPFAAAFMRESSGYFVGDQRFPACAITERDARDCLAEVAVIDDIQVVNSRDLRDGYSGMIVATGRKR